MHRILVVEDSLTDAGTLKFLLEAEGFHVEVAHDGQEGLERFRASNFGLVVTDVLMPGLSGYELCSAIKAHPSRSHMPVILLTALGDPLHILDGIACGADSFVTKPYKAEALLGRVHEMLGKQARQAETEAKAGIDVTFLGKTFTINSDKEQILGMLVATCEDIARTNRELRASQDELAMAKREVERRNDQLLRAQQELEERVRERTLELVEANIALRQEVDDRRRAEAELRANEERFAAFMDNSPAIAFVKDAAGRYTYTNVPHRRCFNLQPGEWIGKTDLEIWPSDIARTQRENDLAVLAGGQPVQLEEVLPTPDGTARVWMVFKFPFPDGSGGTSLGGMAVDITDRKHLEEQLQQSQKMEAVGRLAGGVAHDFNNLLTIICGCSELMLNRLPSPDPGRELIEHIKEAGERAASLTRQLLTFSRKQVLEPKVLDINTVVAAVDRMLRRLIGEDVELATTLQPGLGRVLADAGHVEQILLNLALNSRDAMPRGGKLTIKTANVELDENYAHLNPDVKPGSYVVLAVSDTGCGMDEATRRRIFEPFFTTKSAGNGTGLGLATVFGIVKQSGGHIAVQSAPGRGTVIKVFLPRVHANLPAKSTHDQAAGNPSGSETLLLVEDEDGVRQLASHVLRANGYTVLEAANGADAMRVCQQHKGPIDLLVTDVVMPGFGGRELADRLTGVRPDTRVLFLSGYMEDAVVRHGVQAAEVAFLQKPFKVESLVRKVREVLDEQPRNRSRGLDGKQTRGASARPQSVACARGSDA
jgi:PAS domain S-box-containing protein